MLFQFKPGLSVDRAGCVLKEHAAFFNVYSTTRMIRIMGTIFAGLLGLAFGSFLNVCLSRWPEGESVVRPRSHCRDCDHALAWWENVPLLSWVALRGRCRTCGAWIGWRYPLVELAVGGLWALESWKFFESASSPGAEMLDMHSVFAKAVGMMIFYWLLVALAVLDNENLWIPDWLTLPGTALGFFVIVLRVKLNSDKVLSFYGALGIQRRLLLHFAFHWFVGILIAAALILLIRWLYKLIRKREGMGLGDVKLMAMLAAWLGLPGALLAFGLGAVLGAVAAIVLLAVPARNSDSWAATKLPFGTFLCIGGIISSAWGERMIAAYLHWAGL